MVDRRFLRASLLACLAVLDSNCSPNPTSLSGFRSALDGYVTDGTLLRERYNNFVAVKSARQLSGSLHEIVIELSEPSRTSTATVEVREVAYYQAHASPVFARYVYKWYSGFRLSAENLRTAIQEGRLTAIARAVMVLKTDSAEITIRLIGALESRNQSGKLNWNFDTRSAAYQDALEAFERAYTEEQDPEFLQFRAR